MKETTQTRWSKVINVEIALRVSINSFQFVCSRRIAITTTLIHKLRKIHFKHDRPFATVFAQLRVRGSAVAIFFLYLSPARKHFRKWNLCLSFFDIFFSNMQICTRNDPFWYNNNSFEWVLKVQRFEEFFMSMAASGISQISNIVKLIFRKMHCIFQMVSMRASTHR